MKKLPITIKAAFIGGFFTIVAVLLIPLTKSAYNSKPAVEFKRYLSDRNLKKVIGAYIDSETIDVEPPGITHASFAPNGKNADFYAKVTTGNNNYIVAFSKKTNGYENIYFNKLKRGHFWEVTHITLDKITYLVCYSVTGTGHYMTIHIYSYDGIGKMKEVFTESDLFGGDLYIRDNTVYLNGNGHKFKLIKKNGTFALTQYKEKLHPVQDSGNHVLSYVPQGKHLKIMFDGKYLNFAKKGESSYDSKELVEIKLDEKIIDDDNIVGYPDQYIRLLVQDEMFEFDKGFFTTLIPTKTGETSINISNDYREWYHVRIKVNR